VLEELRIVMLIESGNTRYELMWMVGDGCEGDGGR
jgi:hypothetical protein